LSLALTKLTMWIQSFNVSDNSFGKIWIIRLPSGPLVRKPCYFLLSMHAMLFPPWYARHVASYLVRKHVASSLVRKSCCFLLGAQAMLLPLWCASHVASSLVRKPCCFLFGAQVMLLCAQYTITHNKRIQSATN